MNILLYIALLACSRIAIPCCTLDEMEETWRWGPEEIKWAERMANKPIAQLPDGMWGTQYWLPEYTAAEQLTPLTAESVSMPFFVELADKEEEDKGKVLKIAVEHPTYPYKEKRWYLNRRANIAAIILVAKINLQALGEHHHLDLLHQATEYADFHLAQLLLDNGASIHECDGRCDSLNQRMPIFNAESKEFALMLIERGALQDGHADRLLHHLMDGHHSKLATFYIQQGMSPLSTDARGNTPLFTLVTADSYNRSSISKAKMLLETLTPQQKVMLINHTNKEGKNVFNAIADVIAWWNGYMGPGSNVQRLNELQQFLEHIKEHPEEKL